MQRRTDVAERRILASSDTVYQAFVDPVAIATWLPPEGARATIDAFEPRAGGAFCATLIFSAAPTATGGKTTENSDAIRGHFVDLVPGDRVTWAINFVSDDPAFSGTMTMRWRFRRDAPGNSLVTVTAENVPPGIKASDHQKGMQSSLANLARYVEGSDHR